MSSIKIPPNIDLSKTMKAIKESGEDRPYFSLSAAEQNALLNKYAVYKTEPTGPGNKKYARGGGVRKVNYSQ